MKTKLLSRMKLLSWIIVLILGLQLVLALGIRPAKTTLIFEEGRDHQETFWVVNNEGREFSVRIAVGGEMAQYVTLHTKELTFRSDDGALPVEFEVHLPEEVPPGISLATIIVEEDLPSSLPDTISSKIVLKHDLLVQGAYPDKYIVAKLNFHESANQIRIVSEVENLGKKDIGTLQTTFYVNDKQQQVRTLETETVPLKTKENKLLAATITRSAFDLGEYQVSAVTRYDDQIVEIVKKLIVGQPDVEITYFDKYFTAYKVNPYSMDLLNKWNQQLENVFVNVEVKKEGKKIDEFRTKSVDLEAEMTKRIEDYFDARDKGPGTYTFDMMVNFWKVVSDAQKTFHFESELLAEGKVPSPAALAGAAGSSLDRNKDRGEQTGKSSLFPMLWWLLAVAALAVFLGLGGYVLWRYRHRKEYERSEEAF